MADMRAEQEVPFLALPLVGNVLTILTGLAFIFVCMVLPLVGPAAVHGSGSPGAGPAEHLNLNYIAFTAALLVSLVLGLGAIASKIERRKVDGSPLPFYSFALVGILLFIGIAFALGLLSI